MVWHLEACLTRDEAVLRLHLLDADDRQTPLPEQGDGGVDVLDGVFKRAGRDRVPFEERLLDIHDEQSWLHVGPLLVSNSLQAATTASAMSVSAPAPAAAAGASPSPRKTP